MNPRTGKHRKSPFGLGLGSAMNRDSGISHVLSGKLIIQKTLNRHHLTCWWFDQWIPRARESFVWKMKYGKEDEKLMEK